MLSSMSGHMENKDAIRCVTGTAHGPERPYPVLQIGDIAIFPKDRDSIFKIRDELQRWLDTAEPFQNCDLTDGDRQVAKLVLFGKILPPAREPIAAVMAAHE